MLAPILFLAMQQSSVPISDRGSVLFHQCQAVIREDDSPSGGPDADLPAVSHCLDFIEGFSEGLSTGGQACFGRASHGTMIRVYVAFMQAHPTYMDEAKGIGVYISMLQTYPCPKK